MLVLGIEVKRAKKIIFLDQKKKNGNVEEIKEWLGQGLKRICHMEIKKVFKNSFKEQSD